MQCFDKLKQELISEIQDVKTLKYEIQELVKENANNLHMSKAFLEEVQKFKETSTTNSSALPTMIKAVMRPLLDDLKKGKEEQRTKIVGRLDEIENFIAKRQL